MKPTPEELARMSWHERATWAFEEAVGKVIAEHKRLGLPLAIWRDGQVVHISPEEAEAEFNAQRAARRAAGPGPA
jgi:hypothetical protein